MVEKVEQVKIDDLVFDREIYPRLQVRWETVHKYKEAMRAESVFPPILVARYKGKLYLLDGWHRVEAHKRLGAKEVQAIIIKPKNRNEMFTKAVECNTTHGRTLNTKERARILYKMKEELGIPDGEISKILKIPIDGFSTFLKRVVKTKKGKTVYVQSTVLDAMERKGLTEEDIAEKMDEIDQSPFQTKLDNLLDQLIELLQGDIFPLEDEKIYPKAMKIHKLLGDMLDGKS